MINIEITERNSYILVVQILSWGLKLLTWAIFYSLSILCDVMQTLVHYSTSILFDYVSWRAIRYYRLVALLLLQHIGLSSQIYIYIAIKDFFLFLSRQNGGIRLGTVICIYIEIHKKLKFRYTWKISCIWQENLRKKFTVLKYEFVFPCIYKVVIWCYKYKHH